MIRRSKSRSSQSSSVHPPPQPTEGLSETESRPTPTEVMKWADVPEQVKEQMWKHIQENVVLQSLGKRYKDYEKDIKDKYYSSWNTDEKRLHHGPPDVSNEDWAWLVQYWGSPKVQSKFEELSVTQEGGCSSSIGDEIYTQVMGEQWHGRVHGNGLGTGSCNFFKWCDIATCNGVPNVVESSYPTCLCGAGKCIPLIEKDGKDAGKDSAGVVARELKFSDTVPLSHHAERRASLSSGPSNREILDMVAYGCDVGEQPESVVREVSM
ncbi:hypothetical protein MRB53_028365 [Persea americana]|uniref:Uncharacterized protein n=1 Tax=Persea americana TaxID=3435 RepID=A0ACC2KFN3_PERAE|nr:hypothetical protein MRB53_028365 [Persea americana]